MCNVARLGVSWSESLLRVGLSAFDVNESNLCFEYFKEPRIQPLWIVGEV